MDCDFLNPDGGGGATLMEFSSTAAAALMMESLVDFCALSEELPFPMEDRSVTLASSLKSASNANRTTTYDEKNSLCEMEYPYLDQKPEIGRRGVKKSKRNALETELQRHVANRALLQKRIVVENGKVLGKRRQARILSECSDDFSVDVPYSLNRKNRWANVDAERIVKNAKGNYRVAAVEEHLSIDSAQDDAVIAYHERNAEGVESSKKAKSRQGAKLETLLPKAGDDEDASVLYKVMRCERGRSIAHIAKKKAGQNVSVKKANAAHNHREEFDLNNRDNGMISSVEPDEVEDSETVQQYRHRARTYTLSDFVLETSPVFVRSQSIESLDSDDRMEDLQIVPEGVRPFVLRSLPVEARQTGLFESFVLNVSKWANASVDEIVHTVPSFRWIDTKMKNFFVDLTGSLPKSGNSILVALIDMRLLDQNELRVIVNGSMKNTLSAKDFKAAIIDACEINNFSQLLAAITNVVVSQIDLPAVENGNQAKEIAYTSEVNPDRFAFLARAYNDYQIFNAIDEITKPTIIVDARVLNLEELDEDTQDDDFDFDEDEFEKIDMDEVLSSDDSDEEDDVQVIEAVPDQCFECGLQSARSLITIPDCEHSWCRECLARILGIMMRSGGSIGCPGCTEHPPLPVAIQTAVLPMAMVVYHSKLVFKRHIESLSSCPKCTSLVVGEPFDHKHLRCDSCSTNFCGTCVKEPHWPLSCDQAASWKSKFDVQFDMDSRRAESESPACSGLVSKRCQCDHTIVEPTNHSKVTCEMCGLVYDWKSGRMIDSRRNKYMDSRFVLQIVPTAEPVEEKLPPQANLISAQFSLICTEMRRARVNLAAARDFEKKCDGFGVNPKELRKTVLYLIEFGYAWLYKTRNDKPENWNAVKSQLTKLRNNFVAVDEVLHRQPQGAASKMKALEKQIDAVIALF